MGDIVDGSEVELKQFTLKVNDMYPFDDAGENNTFTLEFVEGMTWGDWLESEYNTVSRHFNDDLMFGDINAPGIDGVFVTKDDVIMAVQYWVG